MKFFQLPVIVVGCMVTASAFADTQNPSIPNNVSASPESDSSVSVSWNASSDNTGVVGYNVYRDNEYYTTVRSTNYTDSSVSPGATHRYQVTAFDAAENYSPISSSARVTVPSSSSNSIGQTQNNDSGNSGAVSAPTGLRVSVLSSSRLQLQWSEVANASGYNVYRDGDYHSTVRSATTFRDSVSSGRDYRYYVTSFSDNNQHSARSTEVVGNSSGGSGEPSAQVLDDDTSNTSSNTSSSSSSSNGPVSAPTDLQISALNRTELQLEWSEAANATGYNVYRDGSYHSTVKSATTYLDSVESGREYRYYVTSFNDNGQYSPRSAEVVGSGTGASSATAQNQVQSQNDRTGETSSVSNSSGVPAGYNLVFNEEFQGSSLDRSKWNSQYRWGPDLIINNELQYYVDTLNQPNFGHSPFEFDGEHMTINAIRTPNQLSGRALSQPYLSGAITTYQKFTMRYGYVEMRARMPRGRGMWPAFWLLHNTDHDRRPEIDVVEMLGHQTNLVYNTYHRFDNGNLVSSPSFQVPGPDYAADFHTYAVRWEPGLLVWYVDGVERNRFDDSNVSHEDMYLLLNLAVGGWWPGAPDSSTPFPARFTIDYIRAYTKP